MGAARCGAAGRGVARGSGNWEEVMLLGAKGGGRGEHILQLMASETSLMPGKIRPEDGSMRSALRLSFCALLKQSATSFSFPLSTRSLLRHLTRTLPTPSKSTG